MTTTFVSDDGTHQQCLDPMKDNLITILSCLVLLTAGCGNNSPNPATPVKHDTPPPPPIQAEPIRAQVYKSLNGETAILNRISLWTSLVVSLPASGGSPTILSKNFGGTGFAIDSASNYIIATGDALMKVTPSGTSSLIATAPTGSQFIDVTIDGSGNYIVSDNQKHQILRLTTTSNRTTITAVGTYPVGTTNELEDSWVRVDGNGNYIIVEDNVWTNDPTRLIRVYVMTPEGTISTPSLSALMPHGACGLTFDAYGNYVVASPQAIYTVTPGGVVSTLVSNANFGQLGGVVFQANTGSIIFADRHKNVLYSASTNGGNLQTIYSGSPLLRPVDVALTATVSPRPAGAGATYTTTAVTVSSPTQGTSLSFAAIIDLTTGTHPRFVTVGDVNGDGKPDIIAVNEGANTVSVWLNTSKAGATAPIFAARQDFSVGSLPQAVAVGDINGDGKPDLVIANALDNTVSVLLNTTATGAATASFAAKQDFTTGPWPEVISLGDINGDGKLDIVVQNNGTNSVSVLLNTTPPGATTPTFAAKQDFTTAGVNSHSLSLGDLNGDGKPDLAVAIENGSGTISVLLNTTAPGATTPSFAARQDFTTIPGANVSLGDINGDGKLDLVVTHHALNKVSVLLNTTAPGAATVSFSATQDFATGNGPWIATLGDLNNDGKPDFVIPNEDDNSVSVLVNKTAREALTPSFASKQDFAVGDVCVSVALADLNGDGRVDIITANYRAGTVSVLVNTTVEAPQVPHDVLKAIKQR
jgi:hypothetical protein